MTCSICFGRIRREINIEPEEEEVILLIIVNFNLEGAVFYFNILFIIHKRNVHIFLTKCCIKC